MRTHATIVLPRAAGLCLLAVGLVLGFYGPNIHQALHPTTSIESTPTEIAAPSPQTNTGQITCHRHRDSGCGM